MNIVFFSYIIVFLAIFSCKRNHEVQTSFAEKMNYLQAKKAKYCQLSADKFKERGWVHGKCDGLLFTALRAIGCNDVKIEAFESSDEPGHWWRDPQHECGPGNGSDSTISKDMMLGLFTDLWWARNSKAVNDTIKYGQAHDWVMGACQDDATRLSKCLLSPGLVSMLFDMQKEMNGGLRATDQQSGDAWPVNTGFQAHLDVLFALLSGAVHGAVNDGELATLKAQAARQPHNALYVAAMHTFTDGNQEDPVEMMLDGVYFPEDRLPNSHDDHCTEYLYQRDEDDKDWKPCPDDPTEEFSGTDLILAASVADGSYFRKAEATR